MRWPSHLLTLDFETFWTQDYTLNKLSTEEYVRSPLFKSFGAAVKYNNSPSRWVSAVELPLFFRSVPWRDVALLCQNAHFDGLILSHHYGIRPELFLCTLSMAHMALPRQRHSLAKLASHFELPPKGEAVNLTKGLSELPPQLERALGEYACHDADLTREVFRRLLPSIPYAELLLIDETIRLFVEPRLVLDKPRARKLLASEIRGKRSALRRLGVAREQLSSTDQFAALLTDRFGIEVEMKAGKPKKDGTPRFIPALAKTDPFMKSLLEDDNSDVQALAALRLEVKSTLEETRLRRLLQMNERGPLPVYLKFSGAHTKRWSGGDKTNWQNFTRGSELRRCIKAPPGYKIVVADKSQIEARMLNTLAGQWDVLSRFDKGDPYSAMASSAYGYPINKKDNPGERQVGKVLELACGYGMGGPKLRETLRRGALGGAPVIVDLDKAKAWVNAYRASHDKVVDYWRQAETVIQLLYGGAENYPWGPMVIDRGYIRHPASGVALDYTGLVREEGEWRMRDRAGKLMLNTFGSPIRLYGGLVTENVVQWLSRMNIAEDMVRLRDRDTARRFPLVMMSHDELACLARAEEADECLSIMLEEMTKRPSWLPTIPLAAEGGHDECYSK
jgi:hypothetical protein